MQTVSETMSRNAATVAPGETIRRAAQLMRDEGSGALPVCDGRQLAGTIADRGPALRGGALGKTPQDAHVDEIMSGEVRRCYEDRPLDGMMTQMADARVRRIPVVTPDTARRPAGIVARGDLATRAGAGARPGDDA